MSADLHAALDAWRADRSNVALAAAVDHASSRSALDAPPKRGMQRWWTTRAKTYDAEMVSSLLACLRWNARGNNVSFRTILLRDTPLVAALRASGPPEPDLAGVEWLNLVDRIGLMLAWPDDPRVAIALAWLLHEAPFQRRPMGLLRRARHRFEGAVRRAIVARVLAIGDLRAIEVASHALDEQTRLLVSDAAAAAPVPATPPAALDATLAGVWSAVAEEPASLERRLILADVLGERDDPRGELIALQCAPLVAIEKAKAAGETLDPSGLFGVSADKIAAALEKHWHRWLGEVALVVHRQSRFSGGLLANVLAGHAGTPPWAWDRITDHHELCAVQRVQRTPTTPPVVYARFVTRLARVPPWVHIDVDTLVELAAVDATRLTGIAMGMTPSRDQLARVFARVPRLERIDLGLVNPEDLAEVVRVVAPLTIAVRLTIERATDAGLVRELRAMPHVHVRG